MGNSHGNCEIFKWQVTKVVISFFCRTYAILAVVYRMLESVDDNMETKIIKVPSDEKQMTPEQELSLREAGEIIKKGRACGISYGNRIWAGWRCVK